MPRSDGSRLELGYALHCWWWPPNGSRLSCGRLARRRKAVGRKSVPRQGHNTPLPLERSPPASFKRLLGGNNILALDEAAGVLVRATVLKNDVTLNLAEQRDPATDEDGNARDYEAVNEPSLMKPLNRNPAILVNVSDATSCKLRHDVRGRPGHSLHHSSGRCGVERSSAEHEHGLLPIGPGAKRQDGLERLAPDD